MFVVFSVILVAILFGIYTKKKWTYIVFDVVCITAIYYWVYKNKENYIVHENVKDISTFLF
jgi:general stress protein CsbA